MFTRACHWYLFWARWIQSTSHHTHLMLCTKQWPQDTYRTVSFKRQTHSFSPLIMFFSYDSWIITVTTQHRLPGWRSSATGGTSMILRLVTHKAVARAVQTAAHIAFEVLRHVEVRVSHVTLEGPGTCEALATERAVRRTTYSTATANPAPS